MFFMIVNIFYSLSFVFHLIHPSGEGEAPAWSRECEPLSEREAPSRRSEGEALLRQVEQVVRQQLGRRRRR